jgi:hypothetical protein
MLSLMAKRGMTSQETSSPDIEQSSSELFKESFQKMYCGQSLVVINLALKVFDGAAEQFVSDGLG